MMVAIVQARLNSTRLPAKVLLDLAGAPVLSRVIERLRRARKIDRIVVATTTADRDDAVVDMCARLDVGCFRGAELDVLNRYYRAAVAEQAEAVVRITSDCPLIDPEIVDEAITLFASAPSSLDYVVNEDYPRGFDVEVISMQALERAWHEDKDPASREHVTPYIVRHPDLFRLAALKCPKKVHQHRVTLDTLEDYYLIFKIVRELSGKPSGWREIVALLDAHPQWAKLNAHVKQVRVPESLGERPPVVS